MITTAEIFISLAFRKAFNPTPQSPEYKLLSSELFSSSCCRLAYIDRMQTEDLAASMQCMFSFGFSCAFNKWHCLERLELLSAGTHLVLPSGRDKRQSESRRGGIFGWEKWRCGYSRLCSHIWRWERTCGICLSGSRWPYSMWYKMKPLSGWDTWEAIGREVAPDLVIWSGKWERGQDSLEVGEGGKDRRKEECKITRMSKKARRNHAANYLSEKERQLTHVIRCVTIHT